MFGRVARRYDLANHVLSLGVDFWWRARAARLVQSWKAERILDLATGSGDLALAMAKHIATRENRRGRFLADDDSDRTQQRCARSDHRRCAAIAVRGGIVRLRDDRVRAAQHHRLRFGVARNVACARRGGHVLVLDFSIPRSILRAPYRFYLHRFLPTLAGLLTGEKEAYEYLATSIEEFPSGNEMLQLIEANGFTSASAREMTGGVVTMYSAQRA